MNMQIKVVDRDGEPDVITWEPDQTLMEALRDSGLPVLASCGGEASCATCHVLIDAEHFARTGPRTEDEMEMLEEAPGFLDDASRLACQVSFGAELAEMRVVLAPEG
jgi:2Fe-2S ferredoxin